jgi:hypothetical protein
LTEATLRELVRILLDIAQTRAELCPLTCDVARVLHARAERPDVRRDPELTVGAVRLRRAWGRLTKRQRTALYAKLGINRTQICRWRSGKAVPSHKHRVALEVLGIPAACWDLPTWAVSDRVPGSLLVSNARDGARVVAHA